MTFKQKWSFLQLFAGDGAGAGSAGGTAGDGGQGAPASGAAGDSGDAAQRLRGMGVPEGKIAKYAKAYDKRAKGAAATAQPEQQTAAEQAQAQDAAAKTETAQTEETKQEAKYNWDEVMKDPECNRKMQEIVRERTRKSREAQDALDALTPALKQIAREQGLDPENLDYTALSRAITGEYDDKALELGLPKDTVMKLDQQQRINEETMNRKHLEGLIQQGEALKAIFPNFDLRAELENPQFLRLTSRGVGISVEDAFRLVHRKELELAQAQIVDQKAAERIQNTIRAGAARPDESGASSQAPSVTQMDWRKASPEQIRAQAQRIRLAAAQGRKLRPGE